jgi:hypothetical protein
MTTEIDRDELTFDEMLATPDSVRVAHLRTLEASMWLLIGKYEQRKAAA